MNNESHVKLVASLYNCKRFVSNEPVMCSCALLQTMVSQIVGNKFGKKRSIVCIMFNFCAQYDYNLRILRIVFSL